MGTRVEKKKRLPAPASQALEIEANFCYTCLFCLVILLSSIFAFSHANNDADAPGWFYIVPHWEVTSTCGFERLDLVCGRFWEPILS